MKKNNKKGAEKPNKNKPLEIKPVKLKRSQIICDFELNDGRYCTFGVNREYLPQIGSKGDLLVLTAIKEPQFSKPVIVKKGETDDDRKGYFCGTIEKDKLTGVDYFKDSADENAFPMMLDKLTFYGEIIGFCSLSSELGTTQEKIHFMSLSGAGK